MPNLWLSILTCVEVSGATWPKGIDNKENGIDEIRGDVTTKETKNS